MRHLYKFNLGSNSKVPIDSSGTKNLTCDKGKGIANSLQFSSIAEFLSIIAIRTRNLLWKISGLNKNSYNLEDCCKSSNQMCDSFDFPKIGNTTTIMFFRRSKKGNDSNVSQKRAIFGMEIMLDLLHAPYQLLKPSMKLLVILLLVALANLTSSKFTFAAEGEFNMTWKHTGTNEAILDIKSDGQSTSYPSNVMGTLDAIDLRTQRTRYVLKTHEKLDSEDWNISGESVTYNGDGSGLTVNFDVYKSSNGGHDCNGIKKVGWKKTGTYGHWIVTKRSIDAEVWFCPNRQEIDSLEIDSVLKVSFEVKYQRFDNGWKINTVRKLSLTINTPPPSIIAIWDSGIETDDDGNPVVLSGPEVAGYSDLLATLRVGKKDGDYFLADSTEYLNGGNRISGNNTKTSEYPGDRLPSSFSRPDSRTYGRGWSNGRNKFRGGVWFYEGKKNLVAFQPMKDRLDALNAGDVIESHLTLYLVRGSPDTTTTLARVTLTAVIRVSGVTLMISGATRTVVDNGAEFTITANNQPPDDLTVNVTPTNTSGSFLDTDFGASGSTVGISDLSFSKVAGSYNYRAKLNVPLVSDPSATEGMLTLALAADTSTPPNYALGSTVSHTVTILNECSSAAGSVCVSIEGNPVYVEDRTMSGFKVTASHPPGQDLEVSVTGTTNSSDMDCNATIMAGATTATKVCAIHSASPDIKFTIQESQNYIIGEPAAAYSHFVDATKPGMKLTVDKDSVVAGESFTLTAAFTPQGQHSNIAFETEGVDWIDGTPPGSFSSTSAAGTAELTIQTKLRHGSGLNGEILFTASSDPNWLLDENLKHATVNVRNLSLSVASTHTTLTATEGDTTMVKLVASNDPGGPVPVMFTPTNTTGAFLDVSSGPKYLASGTVRTESLTFALDSDSNYSAMLPVKLRDKNFQTDSQGTVTVSLKGFEDGANYAVGSTYRSSTITVSDIPVPAISISSSSNTVTEANGATLTYEFTIPRPVDWDVSIAFAVSSDSTSESGDYMLGSDSPLVISGGSGDTTVSLSIIVADDENYEGNETLVLDLTAVNAEFGSNMKTHALTVTIQDDEEKPEISFKTATHSVAEGGQIELTLVATVPTESAFSIGFTPTNTAGDFLDTSTDASGMSRSTPDLTFAPDESGSGLEGRFSIATRSANGTEDDSGVINIVLDTPAVSAPYTVDDTKKSVTVAVADEFSIPTISVNQSSGTVAEAEGASLTFEFTLSGEVSGNEKITHGVSKDSTSKPEDYMLSPIEFNGTTASLTVKIVNDAVYEGDETVVIELTAANAKFSDGGFVHELTVTITDAGDLPVLSIRESAVSVSEGEVAMVKVKSSVQTVSAVSVRFTVSSSDFFNVANSDASPKELTFASEGAGYIGVLAIGTKSNGRVDQSPGEIRVTLDAPQPSDEYTIIDSASVAVISIVDKTRHSISIRAVNSAVTEGDEIEIVLESKPAPSSTLDVNLKVSQNGDFLAWPGKTSVAISSTGIARFKMPTKLNKEPGTNGQVVVTVASGSNYFSTNSVIVQVADAPQDTSGTPDYSVAASVISMILQTIGHTNVSTADPTSNKLTQALPVFSIDVARKIVAEGETITFRVYSDFKVERDVHLSLELDEVGSFIEGARMLDVELPNGHSELTVNVNTVDDEIAESDGRITATLQGGEGYSLSDNSSVSVQVSDHSDREVRRNQIERVNLAIVPSLMNHSASNSQDVATARFEQAFTVESEPEFEFLGGTSLTHILQTGGEMVNESNTGLWTLIGGSSFVAPLNIETGDFHTTLWGSGFREDSTSNLSLASDYLTGDVSTGNVGFDVRLGQTALTGLAATVSQWDFDYSRGNEYIYYNVRTNGIQSYLGLQSEDASSRLKIFGGYGVNEMELQQPEYRTEFLDGSYHTFGITGSTQAYSSSRFLTGDVSGLNIVGESWFVQQFVNSTKWLTDSLRMDAHHVRIAMEGFHNHQFVDGETLKPSVSIGILENGRKNQSDLSLELGGEIDYQTHNGFEISSSGKIMTFGLNSLYKWEIDGSVDYDSGNDGKGILFSVSPSWSDSYTDSKRYKWANELPGVSNNSFDSPEGARLTAEIEYGFEFLDSSSILTPFNSFERSNARDWEFKVGGRIATNSGIEFEVVSVRKSSGTNTVEHEINLSGNISW